MMPPDASTFRLAPPLVLGYVRMLELVLCVCTESIAKCVSQSVCMYYTITIRIIRPIAKLTLAGGGVGNS
jgi:hypothetical protein